MTSSLKSNVKTKVLEKLIEVKFLSWVSAFSVFISCFFVLWVLNPDGALFTLSTPTGGDLGAHVWGPAFLRDELLPNLRLSGGLLIGMPDFLPTTFTWVFQCYSLSY